MASDTYFSYTFHNATGFPESERRYSTASGTTTAVLTLSSPSYVSFLYGIEAEAPRFGTPLQLLPWIIYDPPAQAPSEEPAPTEEPAEPGYCEIGNLTDGAVESLPPRSLSKRVFDLCVIPEHNTCTLLAQTSEIVLGAGTWVLHYTHAGGILLPLVVKGYDPANPNVAMVLSFHSGTIFTLAQKTVLSFICLGIYGTTAAPWDMIPDTSVWVSKAP
ncbi:hypothetical protein MMC09_004218 [Bachmanniomyces sp. S44760]|nr:hypothetical protein [Bachmanniomyces sp. S44760]